MNESQEAAGMFRGRHGVWFTARGHTCGDNSNNNSKRLETQEDNRAEKYKLNAVETDAQWRTSKSGQLEPVTPQG